MMKGDLSPDEKVLEDVSSVSEQISLARSILSSTDMKTPSDVDKNEALLGVIGFLEACAPRMVQLIEAGMIGALKESTVEKILMENDRLQTTLEACEDPSKVVGEAQQDGSDGGTAEPAAAVVSATTEDFDPFGENSRPADPFADFAAASATNQHDFDAFK